MQTCDFFLSQLNRNDFFVGKCTLLSLLLGKRAAKQNAQFRNVNMLQLINLGNLYSYPIPKNSQ